jgi:uncharacterized peroxidase-related enzyme
MSRINPIRAVFTGTELKPRSPKPSRTPGEATNFHRILAHSPGTLRAFLFAQRALARGQLSPRQREQIALAVAEINGSSYGLSAHYDAGKKLGLTHKDMQMARQATASEAQAATMLGFTQKVVLQRGEVSDEDFLRMRHAGFKDPQIIEIVASIVLCLFANYCNSIARTEVDFPLLQPGSEMPRADLRSAATTGYHPTDLARQNSG